MTATSNLQVRGLGKQKMAALDARASDDIGKPAWITLMVLGFIIHWPIGLAILAYIIWSGRMNCWRHGGHGRWQCHPGGDQIAEEREVAAGEALGYDRHLKSNTTKRRTHSLFRQGSMLYDLIPTMPEVRLLPLIEQFAAAIGELSICAESFGVV